MPAKNRSIQKIFCSFPLYIISVIIPFLHTACTSTAQRPRIQACLTENTGELDSTDRCRQENQISVKDRYELFMIEYDDQGQQVCREQSDSFFAHIKEVNRRKAYHIIVVFVHGWHHNAGSGDSNIYSFGKLLNKIKEKYDTAVSGVYVGWRGAVEYLNFSPVKYFTFWDRKNVSMVIGNGAIAELFVRLEKLSKESDNTKLLFIGHSFGGSVVFSALNNIFQERFVHSFKNGEEISSSVKGVGDMVVLMNPAFEATLYAPLRDIAEEKKYGDRQPPRLLVLTSEKDWATRYAFPAGRFIGTFFETRNTMTRKDRFGKDRHFSQYAMDHKALGHYKPYITHELYIEKNKPQRRESNYDYWLTKAIKERKKHDPNGEKWTYTFESGLTLKHMGRSAAANPYYIVKVDGDIIPDHNNIFDDRLIQFFKELITPVLIDIPTQKADYRKKPYEKK